jgi:tetratricopeptide (TPR) repeat protein
MATCSSSTGSSRARERGVGARAHGGVAVLVLGLVATLTLTAGLAHAQEQREPPSEAMQFFEQAREAYREGRYPDAAADLERALVLDPNAPALLFNLGRVYELMGRYDDSISVYMRLRAVTPPTETEEIARTEQILERLRGAREHAAPPPTIETVGTIEQGPTFVRERGVADVPFWATLITGGVIVVGAAIAGGLALSMHGALNDRTLGYEGYTYESYQSELDSAQILGGVADVAGALGGATIIGALLLFGLRERVYEMWPDRGGEAAVRGSIQLGLGSVWLEGTF